MAAIIAACAKNGVIGKNGKIPWYIKEDMNFFKEMTTGGVLIMGRTTFDGIGGPLPGRKTLVVSGSPPLPYGEWEGDVCFCESPDTAIKLARKEAEEDSVYICGGSRIYKSMLSLAEKMYITFIDFKACGDAYFPEFEEDKYTKKLLKSGFFKDEISGSDVYCEMTEFTRI